MPVFKQSVTDNTVSMHNLYVSFLVIRSHFHINLLKMYFSVRRNTFLGGLNYFWCRYSKRDSVLFNISLVDDRKMMTQNDKMVHVITEVLD